MTTNNTTKRPTHRINYEVKGKDGKTARYIEIGAAWPHSDGKGYSLRFDLLPQPGSYISMRAIERKAETDAAAGQPEEGATDE